MADLNQPILRAKGISFQFPQTQVFDNFSVSLSAGITYITGDENSGKSTLLRLFSGDLAPQIGDVEINGISQKNDLDTYLKQVYLTDPRSTTYDQLSPNDYFNLQREFYTNFDDNVLADLIESLSLTEHVSKSIYMLSAGSKRKVWLAAAFASNATVTLLDEPFAALDKTSINFLLERLESISHQPNRAWVIADYEVSKNLSAANTINIGL